MVKITIAELAADMAKEIVVAAVSNCNISPSEDYGELVAEFYDKTFNGIVETLENSALNEE